MKVLLEVKGTLEKVADLLRDKCSEVKENENYIVGCNQVICGFSYLLYKQVYGINLLQIPARDMTAYGRSLDVLFSKEKQGSSVVVRTAIFLSSLQRVEFIPKFHSYQCY